MTYRGERVANTLELVVYTGIAGLAGFVVPCAIFGVSEWFALLVPIAAYGGWRYAQWSHRTMK